MINFVLWFKIGKAHGLGYLVEFLISLMYYEQNSTKNALEDEKRSRTFFIKQFNPFFSAFLLVLS
jgi:hypothetical protein